MRLKKLLASNQFPALITHFPLDPANIDTISMNAANKLVLKRTRQENANGDTAFLNALVKITNGMQKNDAVIATAGGNREDNLRDVITFQRIRLFLLNKIESSYPETQKASMSERIGKQRQQAYNSIKVAIQNLASILMTKHQSASRSSSEKTQISAKIQGYKVMTEALVTVLDPGTPSSPHSSKKRFDLGNVKKALVT